MDFFTVSDILDFAENEGISIENNQITIYAVWTPTSWTVSFMVDGTVYSTKNLTKTGAVIGLPSGTPTKAGYTFKEWNSKSDGSGITLNSRTKLSAVTRNQGTEHEADISVYAIFTQFYTIRYMSDGVLYQEVSNIASGTMIDLALVTPSKMGYQLYYWDRAESEDAPECRFSSGQRFSIETIFGTNNPSSRTIELTAYWQPASIAVYYDFDDGGGAEQSRVLSTGYVLDGIPPLAYGHHQRFDMEVSGWYTGANGTGFGIVPGETTVLDLMTAPNQTSVTVYACLTPISYSVTFDTGSGSALAPISNAAYQDTLMIGTPVLNGYHVRDWYYLGNSLSSIKETMGISQSAGLKVGDLVEFYVTYQDCPRSADTGEYILSSELELTALYEMDAYTLQCQSHGGSAVTPYNYMGSTFDETGAVSDPDYNFYVDTVLVPGLADSVREGYKFDGWYTGANGTGLKVGVSTTLGDVLSYINDYSTSTVTLHAKWVQATYSNLVTPQDAWTSGTLAFSFGRDGDSAATFSHFTGVKVDNVLVDPSNYDAVSGSVVITLHEDYLATLSEGEHTLTSLFDDGISSTTFTTSAAPVAPTIPVTLTLDASKSIDTAGMQFTFPFAAAQPVSGEEGAQAVPRYDSDDDGDIDNEDAFVMIAAKTLTAAAMPGDVQTISDTIALPDASLFGHAGVYAYTVSESQTGKPADWNYSAKSYKIRLYVVNGENGLEYAESPITIEDLDVDTNSDGIGDKVQLLSFANVNIAETTITIDNAVTGAYGNHAKAFPFTLTVNLPSWAADDQFEITTTGSNLAGDFETLRSGPGTNVLTTTGGEATITFALAHGQSLAVSGLPVGTTFTTSETDSTDGVNVYVPSASHFYDGADGANDGFTDNTTSYAAPLDSNDVPATSLTVFATSEIPNEATMLGVGSGNLVSFSNNLSNPPSPTGIAMAILPYAMMVLVAAGALLVLRNRKRDDDLA